MCEIGPYQTKTKYDKALKQHVYRGFHAYTVSGLILSLRPANDRRRYFLTTSLIGWVQA